MNNINWLNDFKIRASIGTAGSKANVPGNNAYSTFSSGLSTGAYAFNGMSLTNGFYQSQQGNPATHWESDKIANIGFDATLFDNSLNTALLSMYQLNKSGLI